MSSIQRIPNNVLNWGNTNTRKRLNNLANTNMNNISSKRTFEYCMKTENLSSECIRILKTLTNQQRSNLIKRNNWLSESVASTHYRGSVFLYLKHHKSPLLTEENISTAYTMPNDPRFSLNLTNEQMNELQLLIINFEVNYYLSNI